MLLCHCIIKRKKKRFALNRIFGLIEKVYSNIVFFDAILLSSKLAVYFSLILQDIIILVMHPCTCVSIRKVGSSHLCYLYNIVLVLASGIV